VPDLPSGPDDDLDDFEDVRRDRNPLRRAKRAAQLALSYQQRATELSRVRRDAIEEARQVLDMNYTEIAKELGITKGRITQIRGGAPGPERAFFGVGPVHVGVPLRRGADHRMRTYVDAADLAAQDQAVNLLSSLSLAAIKYNIDPDLATPPKADGVVICGPRSAPVAQRLLKTDTAFAFSHDDDRWSIVDRGSGRRYYSPRFGDTPENVEYGYLARHKIGRRVIIHVAGITAIGSSGVLHWLTTHVAGLWAEHGDAPFSMVIRCSFADDETTVLDSIREAGPLEWRQ
jgi:hypothetical protein